MVCVSQIRGLFYEVMVPPACRTAVKHQYVSLTEAIPPSAGHVQAQLHLYGYGSILETRSCTLTICDIKMLLFTPYIFFIIMFKVTPYNTLNIY